MTNFSDMLSKAKAMQEKMKEAQDQIKKIEVEGESRQSCKSCFIRIMKLNQSK